MPCRRRVDGAVTVTAVSKYYSGGKDKQFDVIVQLFSFEIFSQDLAVVDSLWRLLSDLR